MSPPISANLGLGPRVPETAALDWQIQVVLSAMLALLFAVQRPKPVLLFAAQAGARLTFCRTGRSPTYYRRPDSSATTKQSALLYTP